MTSSGEGIGYGETDVQSRHPARPGRQGRQGHAEGPAYEGLRCRQYPECRRRRARRLRQDAVGVGPALQRRYGEPAGRVDDGSAATDYDPEEVARKHTLSTSLAYVEWRKTKINFLDTPGVANFFTETRAALRVADAVLMVVDAVSGPAVQTEKAWAAADELGLPRLIVLSRFDRDRASLERTIVALRKTCHRNVFPVHLPIGEGEACTGIVDVIGMKAFTAPVEGARSKARFQTPSSARRRPRAPRSSRRSPKPMRR